MDLIIEESRASFGAFIQDKPWDEPEVYETTVAPFINWAERALQQNGIRLELSLDPTKLILYLYRKNSKIDTHRLTITCENESDRYWLIIRFKHYFRIMAEPPREPADDPDEAEDYWGGQHATFV